MDEKFVLKATAGHLFSVSGIFKPFFSFKLPIRIWTQNPCVSWDVV